MEVGPLNFYPQYSAHHSHFTAEGRQGALLPLRWISPVLGQVILSISDNFCLLSDFCGLSEKEPKEQFNFNWMLHMVRNSQSPEDAIAPQ